MKRIALLTLLLTAVSMNAEAKSWIDRWCFNGIPLNQFKVEPIRTTAGALSSIIAHTVSHYAAASIVGVGMRQDGLNEIWNGTPSDNQSALIGRAGFIGQLALGSVLDLFEVDKAFMTGYDLTTFTEISTYKMLWGDENVTSDLGTINRASDSDAELSLYIDWSLLNLRK